MTLIKMSKTQKITVILPVYNTELYIGQAIESILGQTFQDFEFIILDDASTDKTFKICRKYVVQDTRIKLIQNNENLGVVKTRNRLLKEVSGDSKYIALMDADDISDITRIEKQFHFLEKNPDISIVGSNLQIINNTGQQVGNRKYPESHSEILKSIFKKNPLAQPSLMIRKKDLETIGNYNEDFERCQDYELWCRFFDAGFLFHNIQEDLLKYRVFPEQGKSKYLKLTLNNTLEIQRKYIFQKQYFSVGNLMYFIGQHTLLVLPNSFILWLFKKTQY